MNYENLQILIGTADEVQPRLTAALEAHPNAKILSSTVTVTQLHKPAFAAVLRSAETTAPVEATPPPVDPKTLNKPDTTGMNDADKKAALHKFDDEKKVAEKTFKEYTEKLAKDARDAALAKEEAEQAEAEAAARAAEPPQLLTTCMVIVAEVY